MVGRTAMSDKHTHRQSDEAREDTLSGERAKFTTTRRDAEEKTEEEDSVKGTDESTVDQNLYLPVMPSNPHVTVSPPVLLLDEATLSWFVTASDSPTSTTLSRGSMWREEKEMEEGSPGTDHPCPELNRRFVSGTKVASFFHLNAQHTLSSSVEAVGLAEVH
mmetsp:Transcript_42827/g.85865  ORF Transcript_42827/g.85865 Transcript_42827/m.85865 type:complete len:162 (+) Transcript_42827:703-1188(+)